MEVENADVVKAYSGANGNEVFLNISDNYSFRRDVSLPEMAALLQEFRQIQLDWLKDFMTRETDRKNKAGHPIIYGLQGSPRVAKNGLDYFDSNLILLAQVPDCAWSILEDAGYLRKKHKSFFATTANVELQRSFLLQFLGDDIATASSRIVTHYRKALCFDAIEAVLNVSADSKSFVASLEAIAEVERRPSTREEREVDKKNIIKSAIPDLFFFWLTQKGVLLRPVRPSVYLADTRGLEMLVLDERARELWTAAYATFSATKKRRHNAEANVKPNQRALAWERDLFTALLITVSSSTIREGADISEALFQDLFAKLDAQVASPKMPDMLATVFRAIRDVTDEAAGVPLVRSLRQNGPLLRDFAWVNMTYSDENKTSFPDGFVGPYEPKENLIALVQSFEAIRPRLERKYPAAYYSTMNAFLAWMATAETKASKVSELARSDINDGREVQKSPCFRAFLIRKGIQGANVTANISRLGAIFDFLIDDLPERVPNPIDMRFDTVKTDIRRGQTPRRALGRDMLEYIREFNKKDDFAFSRSRPAHNRRLMNRETRQYEDVWFPGIARLIDLLLKLPLRGFQARFLDSGEGDEFVPDFPNESLEMVRNTLLTATKGRRQGVLAVIPGLQTESLLGLYINSNKTRVDRETGYEIPWCDEELRDSLLAMFEWQRQWDPLVAPIKCAEKGSPTENPDVAAAIPMVYPLFRDPRENGYPVSPGTLRQYWDDLLAAVEDSLAAENPSERPIRLTDTVEETKGTRTWNRRVARYDIHTLRVSGISALIAAGMPPDLVSRVAGHSTVVMTLYYNVISAFSLNAELKAALMRAAECLDGLDGLREEEYQRVAEFLVNSRDSEDAIGLSMLRERVGHGTGDFDVMSHGICPGGECKSGGIYQNQVVGYRPVPRPMACSLCRYRLTGPMFLPGLVLNANRLVHELRRKGQEIAELNRALQGCDRHSANAHAIRGQIEAIYRETEIVSEEWAAEFQYVHLVHEMLPRFSQPQQEGEETADVGGSALITGLEKAEVEVKLESRSDFALLQNLSEGVQSWFGFRPNAALADHREFLNEVMSANGLEPFLLRLSGADRDIAANLLGRAIVAAVPDDRIDDLRSDESFLTEFPGIRDTMRALRAEAIQHVSSRSVTPALAAAGA